MKTMAISEFKARALKTIANVSRTKERLVITKRGNPIVEVVPYHKSDSKPRAGKLSQTLVFEKDIVSPLGEKMWSY